MGWGLKCECGLLIYVLVVMGREIVNGERVKLFVLGDSLVDCGTNNYINSSKEHRANYFPYGLNAFSGHPTGRFSDGKVTPDFIAELANLPLIPPYLQSNADHSYGANFASGGAGVLSDTNQGEVVDMGMQVAQLSELKYEFKRKFGHFKAHQEFSQAVYCISIGLNDYKVLFNDYEGQISQNKDEFVKFVIGKLSSHIQGLYNNGARKFLNVGLKDLGCTPHMRAHGKGECLHEATYLSASHNAAAENLLISLESKLAGFKYIFFDYFKFLRTRIEEPHKYGFIDGHQACCGSGPFRGLYTCGGKSGSSGYELCENPAGHVFFDSFHSTEGINRQAAHALWLGEDPTVRPLPLSEFFNKKVSPGGLGLERKGKAKMSLTLGHHSY
ncbi:GDSL esterase/lipase 5 [Amborella trichopoda]|uniref:Uncharacterized protein n=1 Tax=Amborella trichopoda TaxID=13333 RepID=W1PF72_AMBTC|nr:GDSL esterase/lipase 5 [Amborella trichopoda]ERN06369.1 hypothetical protein AMTR_s00016p00247270 [Amborella trichopoda]|eukprot:XP_006844694.1 GDSL esterase/lipase 5 [Amborella trichopoda]